MNSSLKTFNPLIKGAEYNEEPESVVFSLEGATDKFGPVSEYPRALSVVTNRRKTQTICCQNSRELNHA
jgi:hypothetical protein